MMDVINRAQIMCWMLSVVAAIVFTPLVVAVNEDSWCPSPCQCNRTLLHVDCSDAAISTIPPELPSDTVSLDLSANPLDELIKVPPLGRLRVLRVTRHSLSKLQPDSLRTLKALRTLDLSGNLLQSIPRDIVPPALETLILSGNNMLEFENNSQPILQSPSLRTLDLSYCSLKLLPNDAFYALPSLKNLNLSNNYLVTLPPNEFHSLSALSTLDLSSNLLSPLPNTTFQHNPFLVSLNLSGNPWSTRYHFPRNSSHPYLYWRADESTGSTILISSSLEVLDMSGCSLRHLSVASLASMVKIRHLKLSYTGLRRVDRSAFEQLTSLETLDITHNMFEVISGDLFRHNPKLKSVSCSSCFNMRLGSPLESESISYLDFSGSFFGGVVDSRILARLPSLTTFIMSGSKALAISSMAFVLNPHLTEINLSHSGLRGLPTDVFILNHKLSKINLSKNLIGGNSSGVYTFPQTMAAHLDLSNNYFQTLNKNYFSGALALTHLNLSGNPLTEWEEGTFSKLQNLTSLDLSGTYLLHIDPNSFANNNAMHSLFFSSVYLGRLISRIPSGSSVSSNFIYAPTLKELDISYCGIQHLTNGSFSGFPALEKLILSKNGLRSLDLKLIETSLPKLMYLDLQDNPWRCDCRLAKLRDWWTKKIMEPRRHWVICDKPENLRDHTWDAINNCSGSVANAVIISPSEEMKGSANVHANKTTATVVVTDPPLFKNASANTSNSNNLITAIPKSIPKRIITAAHYVTPSTIPTAQSHTEKHQQDSNFPRPLPPMSTAHESSGVKRLASGAVLGFIIMTLAIFFGAFIFTLICRTKCNNAHVHQRVTDESTEPDWEL